MWQNADGEHGMTGSRGSIWKECSPPWRGCGWGEVGADEGWLGAHVLFPRLLKTAAALAIPTVQAARRCRCACWRAARRRCWATPPPTARSSSPPTWRPGEFSPSAAAAAACRVGRRSLWLRGVCVFPKQHLLGAGPSSRESTQRLLQLVQPACLTPLGARTAPPSLPAASCPPSPPRPACRAWNAPGTPPSARSTSRSTRRCVRWVCCARCGGRRALPGAPCCLSPARSTHLVPRTSLCPCGTHVRCCWHCTVLSARLTSLLSPTPRPPAPAAQRGGRPRGPPPGAVLAAAVRPHPGHVLRPPRRPAAGHPPARGGCWEGRREQGGRGCWRRDAGVVGAVCWAQATRNIPPHTLLAFNSSLAPARRVVQGDGKPEKGVKLLADGKSFVKDGVEYRCV